MTTLPTLASLRAPLALAAACCALWFAASPGAHAQTPAADPVATPAETPAAPPAPLETCRSVTDKAMSSDIKVLTAQSQKLEVAEQVRLATESVAWWTQAVALCEGRAKDRALRNLSENQKISATLSEKMGAGPQCAAAHKDGQALQELAVQALGERRWSDASVLFHKAEDTWDLAAERCTGSQRDVANQRRDQSEIDSHNAEHCAPLFDQAREATNKLRASSAAVPREEKQERSLVAETLWRDALERCKGNAARDSAGNNANALARERGTPFVARRLPTAVPNAALPAAPAVALLAPRPGTPAASSPAALAQTAANTAPQVAAEALANTAASLTAPPSSTPPAPRAQPEEFSAKGMHFKGQFVIDQDGSTYSGVGKLRWPNGDTFDGTLLKGLRHGRGLFVWANGQRYDGDWVQDRPEGQAQIQFVNGNHYEGAASNGTPMGRGRMAYASGDTHTGHFVAGIPNGKGIYVWKNGQQFDGDWVNGQPHGSGTMKFPSGDVYQGAIQNGEPQGEGSFQWANGDRYTGQWEAGKKHGQGTFTWKSGDYWQGQYHNDLQASGKLVQKAP